MAHAHTVFSDWQHINYKDAWDRQQKLLEEVQQRKFSLPEKKSDLHYFNLCEHPHVYTLGKSGKDNNLLVNNRQLKDLGATFFHIDRGGDITYHGPGQIVGYPIVDLDSFGMGVKQYVFSLEELIIRTIAEYGLHGERLDGATGVWLDAQTPKARKICAIGVRVGHRVTMHGFAFNVNTDLHFFDYINPCGFTDKGVTSLQKELGKQADIEEVKQHLKTHFETIFETTLI
jgi:lipoyl(octanoyl) transferase